MSGRRLVLVRHGRTAWNASGRAQGHRDVEIDEQGHRQAQAVAPYVAGMRPEALWTSDLRRARQTCEYLEHATGLTATPDPRLREYDVGEREGMTSEQFEATYPAAFTAWQAGDDLVQVPGAESAERVADRMLPALREVLDALSPGATGVVVSHGACLKVGLLALLGWPVGQAPTLHGIDNCAWVSVTEGPVAGALRLEAYNRQAQFASTPPVG